MPKDERRKIFNQRVKFMSHVDLKLQRFVKENLRVKKFLVHITLVSNNLRYYKLTFVPQELPGHGHLRYGRILVAKYLCHGNFKLVPRLFMWQKFATENYGLVPRFFPWLKFAMGRFMAQVPNSRCKSTWPQEFSCSTSVRGQVIHVAQVKISVAQVSNCSSELAPHVDSWMEMVTNLCVRELELYLTVGRERFYVLPMKVFAMESLTVLNLRGCLLSSPLDMYAIKRCSLIELHLRDVSIDEGTIQNLIASISSMEVFTLKNCLGFKNLEIYDHHKLKKVMYHPHKDLKVKKFSINVPNLEELDFCSVDKDKTLCEIINVSSSCRKLKYLSLCGIHVGAKWLQSLISSFQLREHLVLGGCVLQKVLKLSSPVLKEVHICSCKDLVEAEFDTPSVRIFDYQGRNMLRLYMDSVAATRVTELSVRLDNMDTSWFMKLNKFLRDNKFQDLTLSMTRRSVCLIF